MSAVLRFKQIMISNQVLQNTSPHTFKCLNDIIMMFCKVTVEVKTMNKCFKVTKVAAALKMSLIVFELVRKFSSKYLVMISLL